MSLLRALLLCSFFPGLARAECPDGKVPTPPAIPLGALVRTSPQVVLIEVKKLDRERETISFRPVEVLKGKFTGALEIDMSGLGDHRSAVFTWARPKQQAVIFLDKFRMVLCLDGVCKISQAPDHPNGN